MADKEFLPGQKKALDAQGNVLVSASAGSGKTTVLTERITRMIASGQDVRRLCVMTFSKAAAAEMKNRIVKKLYDMMREGNHPEIYKQLEMFPFANIGTIDSFCYSLVKKYFAVVGADPAAAPLEPDEAERLFAECIDIACEERLESNDKDFIDFAERYAGTRRLDDVKELVADYRTFLSVQPDPDKVQDLPTEKLCEEYYLDYVKRRLARLPKVIAGARSIGEKVGDSYGENGRIIENNVVVLQNKTGSLSSFFEALSYCEGIKRGTIPSNMKKCRDKKTPLEENERELFNRAVNEYNDFIESAKKFSEAYDDELLKKYGEKDTAALIALTKRTEQLYTERKKRAGKLDFADMARQALAILENEEVRKEVRESFDYIFVDEYQDTNYLQEKLFSYISNGENVFVVGDVKQSIYHFRYAEPKIFLDRMERFDVHRTGKNVFMNENFRSHPDILTFVNEVCSAVMTEEFCRIDYRKNDMMKAAKEDAFPPADDSVRIYLYNAEKEEKEIGGVYSVRDGELKQEDKQETDLVCDLVERELRSEWYDLRAEKYLPVEKKDVAVIASTNARCRAIAKALEERGISAAVAEGDKELFAPRELLVDFLRLAVSTEDVPMVNATLSKPFNLTKKELLSIRANSPENTFSDSLKAYKGEPKTEKKIQQLLSYIEELKSLGVTRKASELMQKILSDGLDGALRDYGEDVMARINRFVSDVSKWECDADVNDFLNYYDTAYEGDKPIVREDSVTVMTVHKSKGLEYPVVIVPSIDKKSVGKGFGGKLLVDRDMGIALKSADSETGVSAENFLTKVLKLKNEAEEREEMARCAYVAFTRAKNRLILVGKKQDSFCSEIDSAKSFYDLLQYATTQDSSIRRYLRYDFPEHKEAPQPTFEERAENNTAFVLSQEYPFDGATAAVAKTTVSELLAKEEFVPKPYVYGKGVKREDAAKIGTAYHLVLQKIPFGTEKEEEVAAFVKELTKNGEIEEKIAEKLSTKKLCALLRTDVMQRAKNNRSLREQPFVLPLYSGEDFTLVQGVIDLIVFEEDGAIIADYKASEKEGAALVDAYRRQLELYGQAAERIFGVKVKAKILLNLLKEYQVEVR